MFRLALLVVSLNFGFSYGDTKCIPGLRPDGTYPSPGELVPLTFLKSEILPAPKTNSDAMNAVNSARAKRGLRPYIEDPALSIGAQAAADFRARHRITGHTTSDFGFLPPGSRASAAGCAAWSPQDGWGSCCAYDNYTYAGAGWRIGPDGRNYMHLFVR